MPTGRNRSTAHVAVLFGCLLLAFAVFAWGLHAKLSLYSPGVEPSNATVAKLLVGQRPQALLTSTSDRHPEPRGLWQLSVLLLGAALLLPELQVRWISATRGRVQPVDDLIPLRLLSRPPPTIHLSR